MGAATQEMSNDALSDTCVCTLWPTWTKIVYGAYDKVQLMTSHKWHLSIMVNQNVY